MAFDLDGIFRARGGMLELPAPLLANSQITNFSHCPMSLIAQNTEPETHFLQDDGFIPNSPLPVLIYRNSLSVEVEDLPLKMEHLFASNKWSGAWRDGIYSFQHYHSTSHEVLGIYRGRASIIFGGDKGIIISVQAGDVIVIPAGVGHKNLRSSVAFGVVGAYPGGRDCDLLRDTLADRAIAQRNLANVPLPECDPLYGEDGPLMKAWK